MDKNQTTNKSELKAPNVALAISFLISLVRVTISPISYYHLQDEKLTWTEGRVFNYITATINIPCLFLLFILNSIATYKLIKLKLNLALVIFLWLLWLIIAIFTILISTYQTTN